MPGNGHVRFGRRAAETDRQKRRHRAAARPHNLVCDPAVLVVAWARVRGNRGKRAAGVEGLRPQSIFSAEEGFLPQLRQDLKARLFTPLPVRERTIPKPGSTKLRRLGIPTARDRTVQAALKLVLEPIFEADFKPCSYGFRPRRRARRKRCSTPRGPPVPRFFLALLNPNTHVCTHGHGHARGPSGARGVASGGEFEPSPGFLVGLLDPSAVRLVTPLDQGAGDLTLRAAH